MNKYWLENIWKPFLLFKEKNEAEEKRRKVWLEQQNRITEETAE